MIIFIFYGGRRSMDDERIINIRLINWMMNMTQHINIYYTHWEKNENEINFNENPEQNKNKNHTKIIDQSNRSMYLISSDWHNRLNKMSSSYSIIKFKWQTMRLEKIIFGVVRDRRKWKLDQFSFFVEWLKKIRKKLW